MARSKYPVPSFFSLFYVPPEAFDDLDGEFERRSRHGAQNLYGTQPQLRSVYVPPPRPPMPYDIMLDRLRSGTI